MHEITLCLDPTRLSGHWYQMTPKHHGAGGPSASCWSLAPVDEFRVFDDGDFHGIVDYQGKIYGVLKVGSELQSIGTWQQEVAIFYPPSPPDRWHGHPLFPVRAALHGNLKRQRMQPTKQVLKLLQDASLITLLQRKRLAKGSHS